MFGVFVLVCSFAFDGLFVFGIDFDFVFYCSWHCVCLIASVCALSGLSAAVILFDLLDYAVCFVKGIRFGCLDLVFIWHFGFGDAYAIRWFGILLDGCLLVVVALFVF